MVHHKVHEGRNHEFIVFQVHRVKRGREERKKERGKEEKKRKEGWEEVWLCEHVRH